MAAAPLLLVLATAYSAAALSVESLFSFGPAHGDTRAPPNDDDSFALTVNQPFPFLSHADARPLYVTNNGLVSFLGGFG